jgi:hypothetical protein
MTKKIYNVALRAWGGLWRCGLRDSAGSMASRARGERHCCGLGNSAAGLGMRHAWSTVSPARVGEDRGAYGPRLWSRTIGQRLRGGLNDGTVSGEDDDGMSSREIFGGKFCQPDGLSESLR